jgi:DNA mismatch endonuclease, patch repair protein
MSRIPSKNTKPEMLVRRFLYTHGFRYRLHLKGLPGKPDIVLSKYKTIIFVHGCFWHGHQNCKKSLLPKTRKEWWLNKIETNIQRDKKNINLLVANGWKVEVIWQCELAKNKYKKKLTSLLYHISSLFIVN